MSAEEGATPIVLSQDKHILRLLELQFKYNQRIEEIGKVGIDLGRLVIDEQLLHLALDMLGVPADNSTEYPEWDDNPNVSPPEGFFCRDALGSTFERVVSDGTLIQRLEYVRIVRKWVEDRKKGRKK